MKFNKYWSDEASQLPIWLNQSCIQYKRWKKLKTDDVDIQNRLLDEINRVDKTFKSNKKYIEYPFLCFTKQVSNEELYRFAMLNRTCVSKLVKRFDKRFHTHYKDWWMEQRNSFSFCKDFELKLLEIRWHGYKEECPICLNVPETELVVLECGHVLCKDCVKSLLHINKYNGSFENLVKYANYHTPYKCPCCRLFMPLRSINHKQVIKVV